MAGLWGRLLANSSRTLRSFGYYGGVIGVFIGTLFTYLCGGNTWLLLGAFAVAGSMVQACGRLSCLVYGCCYGRAAPRSLGIRYLHPRSEVCRLSNLTGIPLHPIPLYSILWNVIVGIILGRLWILQADVTLIAGLYLILNGLGRLIEDAYRGEPQTPIVGKWHLYHLMAIGIIIAGVILTTVHTGHCRPPDLNFNITAMVTAVIFGLITWFAAGVDFPGSTRQYARLL
jgi:prolipoprotein diacylglyceryltransferase